MLFFFYMVNWCCFLTECHECHLSQILLAHPSVPVCVSELAVIFYLCAFSVMCHMISEAALASLYHANVFQFPPTKSIHRLIQKMASDGPVTLCLCPSPQTHSHTLWQSPISVARYSHFLSDAHTDALRFRTHKHDPTFARILVEKKHTGAQMRTLVLVLTAGSSSECEQVDLITGTYVGAHTQMHTHTKVEHKKTSPYPIWSIPTFLFSFSLSLFSSLSWLSLFTPQISTSSQHINKEAQSRHKCLFCDFIMPLSLFPYPPLRNKQQ